jgi:hypothetical protein
VKGVIWSPAVFIPEVLETNKQTMLSSQQLQVTCQSADQLISLAATTTWT